MMKRRCIGKMTIVTFKRLKEILEPKSYRNLVNWMIGQTCVEEGIYEWDFLKWVGTQPFKGFRKPTK